MIADVETDSGVEPQFLRELSADQKQRLTEQLDRYLRALEDGESVDPEEIAAQNPDIKEVFDLYLNKLNALYGVAIGFQDARREEGMSTGRVVADSATLGDFTLLREIGRGGMGVVYEAQQKSLDRKVAIKLLSMSSVLDERQIARFRNEARAAGLLHHPNIVPVYSVGAQRGVHYYSMQLIDGTSMDAWIRSERGSEPTLAMAKSINRIGEDTPACPPQPPGGVGGTQVVRPDRDPRAGDWRSIVRWAIDIAGALHCTHEAGVVHRDVKPSNLLLDRDGKMWITDFGLALCQNNHSLTITGDMVGTMRYMSPEQASGKVETVDHRTDIYSLGATLFEMLTLRSAIVGDNGADCLRAIENDDPPRLRDFLPGTPRDLGVVLQKAMAKRKDDRYESAKLFAEDLRAVVDGLPTSAKPLSTAAWVGRWMMRHRRAVTVGAMVLAVAFVWLMVSSLIIHQKMQDTKFAERQHDLLFRKGHTTVDQLGTQVAEQLASIPGAEHVRQSLLNKTLQYYEEFSAAAMGDPTLQAELAMTQSRIGTLARELKSSAEAIPHFRRSADLFKPLVDDGSGETRLEAAANYNHLGLALAEIGKIDEAFARYRQALAIQRELVTETPGNVRYATELAVTSNNLGMLLREIGDGQTAESILRDAVTHLASLAEEHRNNELVARGLSAALANLASLTLETNPHQSVELLRRAISSRLESIRRSSNRLRASAELASLYNNLGSAQLRVDRFAECEKSYSGAIRLLRHVSEIAPSVAEHKRELAISLNNLAIVLQRASRDTEAVAAATEAVEIQTSLMDSRHHTAEDEKRIGAMKHNLATALVALRRYGEAEAVLESAVEHQRVALSDSDAPGDARAYLVDHYSELLRCQVHAGRWEAVERTSVAYRQAAGEDDDLIDQVLRDLARVQKLNRRRAGTLSHADFTMRRTPTR